MRRGLVAAVLTGVALVMVPLPAAAGGWWSSIQIDKDPVGLGETVTATAEGVVLDTEEAQRASEGGYRAYLLQGVDRQALREAMSVGDPDDWWSPPATRFDLGEVERFVGDANLAAATVTFVVPDVPTGLYNLMFCTEGCVEPMGDVIPRLDVAVHADPLRADVLRRLEPTPPEAAAVDPSGQLQRRVDALRADVRRLRTDVDALVDGRREAPAAATAADETASARGAARGDPTAAIVAFATGALATVVGGRLRRRGMLPARREG